jgi:hypothetical protein
MAPRAPKGKQTKTENITIRANPKNKFGLELLARKQHRNISSILDRAIEKAISDTEDGLGGVLDDVWDPEECDRIINIALKYPKLLNYEEELVWKLIQQIPDLWKTRHIEFVNKKIEENGLDFIKQNLRYPLVRKYWERIKALASGEEDQTLLMQDITTDLYQIMKVEPPLSVHQIL